MKSILFAGSEALPFAATGGLGDVMGSLPAAVKSSDPDADVRAVIPLYSQISADWRRKMTFVREMRVHLSWRSIYCGIFTMQYGGVTWYFLDNEYYFKRSALYGEYDDGERFAFFSEAVLELMSAVGFFPEILHCNDWQTALSVILLKRHFCLSPEYAGIKSVYTIHNIDYQGVYGMEILGDVFSLSPSDIETVEYDNNINLTKGAVVCSDFVTTVSPRYAQEIQTEYFSHGLFYVTRMYSNKIDGVLNGIDTSSYDPHTDNEIPFQYTWRSLCKKAQNKKEMQKRFGLEEKENVPVIAMISRLAEHKGFDLVKRVAEEIIQDDVQFVLLGTGDSETECFFRDFENRHKGKVRCIIGYNRSLSRLIYAGADIFLMPSKSEACGLSQMIASRYGTVPVVHEVGGLYDTIQPYGAGGNGFTFSSYNAHDMLYVLREAEDVYRDTEKWQALVKKIMRRDFSWKPSAEKYIGIYDKLISQ